jgi:UDP-3-O-[3-hydroxymyristoyl] glucosamine N-acyltransferase
VSGYPAIGNREWLKSSAIFRRLPEMRKAVSDLDRRLADIEARLGEIPSAGER